MGGSPARTEDRAAPRDGAPIVAALGLALGLAIGATGCPSPIVPAQPEGSTTDATLDASASSSGGDPLGTDAGDSTTGGPVPPSCIPGCGPQECCRDGLCFASEPSCPGGCGPDERCECSPGADPCDCEGTCVSAPDTCPGTAVEDGYPGCLDPLGLPDPTSCAPGSECLIDPFVEHWAACAVQGCRDACECPQAPASGNATVRCDDIDGDGTNDCHLGCDRGRTCPDDMVCGSGGVCRVPGLQLRPGFGDCNVTGGTCQPAEICLIDGEGGAAPAWSVCAQPGCVTADDCTLELPVTVVAPAACGDPLGLGNPSVCYLECFDWLDCPLGMICLDNSWCAWPGGTVLFYEDFEDGTLGELSAIDVDGNAPAEPVAFVDEAWVVSDVLDGGPGANHAAISTSWYEPAGQADDWLVSPAIAIGWNTRVQWLARAPDPAYRDGYQLRISTTGPELADFEAHPPLLELPSEVSWEHGVPRWVDLAYHGYVSQVIHLAWRNDTDDRFLLWIDDIAVIDTPPP